MADLLHVVDEFKADEQWIRAYYADILEVGRILFDEAKTARTAKRHLRGLKDKWEKELRKLKLSPNPKAATERRLLRDWSKITKSYWPGLFYCYSDPRIPQTNNELERLIKDLKRLERYLSKSPNPGKRFVRNAPINAHFINRRTLPGEEFLAKLNPGAIAGAKAALRLGATKTGVLRGARRHFSKLLQEILAVWGTAGP